MATERGKEPRSVPTGLYSTSGLVLVCRRDYVAEVGRVLGKSEAWLATRT